MWVIVFRYGSRTRQHRAATKCRVSKYKCHIYEGKKGSNSGECFTLQSSRITEKQVSYPPGTSFIPTAEPFPFIAGRKCRFSVECWMGLGFVRCSRQAESIPPDLFYEILISVGIPSSQWHESNWSLAAVLYIHMWERSHLKSFE